MHARVETVTSSTRGYGLPRDSDKNGMQAWTWKAPPENKFQMKNLIFDLQYKHATHSADNEGFF